MANGNKRKHLGREILVKRYGGNPEKNALVVKWRSQTPPKTYSWIADELFRLGFNKKIVTRQAIQGIYRNETRA